jgi:hypothetical protein
MTLTRNVFRLPPDLSYVLDGAAEVGEILGCHHAALTMYGSAERIDAIFNEPSRDTPAGGRRHLRSRRLGCAGLVAYASEIIAEMSPVEREAMGSYGYSHARQLVRDYADHLSDWFFTDTIKGGCAIPFHRLGGTEDGTPFPRSRRKLYSPRAMRRYVKLYDDIDWMIPVFASLDAVPVPRSLTVGEEFHRQLDAHIREAREAEFRAFNRTRSTLPPVSRKRRDKRRGVIRRASVMAAAVLGASTVSAFARGEPVVVPGESLAFEFRAAGSLAEQGHGGVSIALLDPSGARLAGLCVYHDETPALDQLTAFALRIAAGGEREIVETGNLFGIEAAALEHPLLSERAKPRVLNLEEEAARIGIAEVFGAMPRRDFREALKAYQAETLPIFAEAVALRVARREVAPLLFKDWPL